MEELLKEVTAAQLGVAADAVPFVGPALPRLVLCSSMCQWRWRVEAPRG